MYFSCARITSTSTRYLRAPLRTSWGVATTTRPHSASGDRAFISACFSSTLSPLRQAGWVSARGTRTVSSKSGTSHDANRTPLVSILVVSTSVALGVFLYVRGQSPARMDCAQDREIAGIDPSLSGRPVRPNSFWGKAISGGDTAADIHPAFYLPCARATGPNDGLASGYLRDS